MSISVYFGDGFYLYDDCITDNQVQAVACSWWDAVVLDRERDLMVDLASSLGEFVGHAVLIGTFQKPRAERLMDLQAGADDSLGEFRGRDRTLVLEVGHASIGKAETDCVSESRRMLSALYLFPVLSV